jgi:hypothetical protein
MLLALIFLSLKKAIRKRGRILPLSLHFSLALFVCPQNIFLANEKEEREEERS